MLDIFLTEEHRGNQDGENKTDAVECQISDLYNSQKDKKQIQPHERPCLRICPVEFSAGVNPFPLWFCCDWRLQNNCPVMIVNVQDYVGFIAMQNHLSENFNPVTFMKPLAEGFTGKREILGRYKMSGP